MSDGVRRLGVRDLFDAVLDPGSFVSWDGAVHAVGDRLRKKLDPEGELKPIETVRGRGYRFSIPRTS